MTADLKILMSLGSLVQVQGAQVSQFGMESEKDVNILREDMLTAYVLRRNKLHA